MDRNVIIARTMLKLAGVDQEVLHKFKRDTEHIIKRNKQRNLPEENLHKALGKHLINVAKGENLQKEGIKALITVLQETGVLDKLVDEAKKVWEPLLRGFGLRLPS